MAIKLQHILETDDNFRKAAGLLRLDLPEHLWGVRDMRSAHTREQDFMAITAEVKVLCQQLKGRGMYTVPSVTSTTSSSKSGGSVHFQPINLAQKSSAQAMDQLLLNSSLNLLDDSPWLQSSSSNGPIPYGQATPQIPAHKGNYPIPPMPYTNQTAVDQHQRAQPTPLLPRMNLGLINVQSLKVITEGKSKGCLSLIPLPKIDEMYAKLKGAKFFLTIDLRSGYYHIALGKDSRAKMAFVMPFGKYKFLQVPFGLAQAPAFFQHLMNKVLDNCSFAMMYLDDIIIFSNSEEEHLAHIEEIFRRLEAADLKMKRSKCDFFKKHIHYLGHLISADGIRPLEDKLDTIRDMPSPAALKR